MVTMLSLRTPTVVTPARLPNARPRVGFTSTRTIMPLRPRRVARAQLLSMVDESSFNLVSQVATASIWSAVAWFGYQFAMQQVSGRLGRRPNPPALVSEGPRTALVLER